MSEIGALLSPLLGGRQVTTYALRGAEAESWVAPLSDGSIVRIGRVGVSCTITIRDPSYRLLRQDRQVPLDQLLGRMLDLVVHYKLPCNFPVS